MYANQEALLYLVSPPLAGFCLGIPANGSHYGSHGHPHRSGGLHLQAELAGYGEYVGRVRYRLLPGVR